MEVVNTKKFEVVFTFVNHANFGIIVEANAVQLLDNGNPSLTFQRIRIQNADYFQLDNAQKAAVELIEKFEMDVIMKKFYTGTKKLKPADFIQKHYNPELAKLVREYIEIHLLKLLHIIKDYPLYWSGKLGEPMGQRIQFANEPTSVLFHFREQEDGMNYFVTLKHQDQKINIFENNAHLLVGKPAWIITEDRLLFFNERVDGVKIKPFFNKRFIHIAANQLSVYMNKFVLPLLENHDVYAKGFDIVTEQLSVKPVLRLNKSQEKVKNLLLYFQYGNWQFPYHVDKRVNVSLEEKEGKFTFHRIRRSYPIEKDNIRILQELGLSFVKGSIMGIDSDQDYDYSMVQWVNQYSDELIRNGFVIEQDFSEVNYFLGKIDVKIKVSQAEDWFDLMAIVRFGSFEIPFTRLKNHILNNKKEFVLPDGSIAVLPSEWFSHFSKVLNFSVEEDDRLKIKKIHISLLEDLQQYLDDELPSADWAAAITDQKIPDCNIPQSFKAEMRSYQKEGYNWMRFLLENKLGALLADDMGLGKTIQTLALIQHLTDEQAKLKLLGKLNLPSSEQVQQLINGQSDNDSHWHGPCIVVCPKSLLYNWRNEANKFAPELKVLTYSGLNRNKLITQFTEVDLVVMSYGTMRNDLDFLKKFEYPLIVLDESQAIKNPSSLTARNLLKIHARHKVALTGTPIENTLLDIWSQMNFLNPGLLGSYTYFEKQFIRPIEKEGNTKKTDELKRFIDPFVLRRTKGQVMKDLPPKVEKIHYCEMSEEQSELYEKIKSQYRNEILSHINEVGISKSRLKIFNGLMHLRQLALNPVLKDSNYEGSSGKDDEIVRMLVRAIENGHKILLFSQFVGYLKNIAEILKDSGIKFCYLDGSMDEHERQDQIEVFQNNNEIRIFLLSLRAGNSGLNLTAADYVFLADPWWNPFTMKQAEDRAHRMGQSKTVMSYKFITKDTIEEKILALQQKKTRLAESIIPDEDTILNNINVEELEELLS